MDISQAFPILMKFEGGGKLINIKGDKGGLTKYGIAQASHPAVDIANLTEQQAIDIYSKEYWQPSYCAELIPDLQYMHFDTAVNCGVVTAIRILQRASKVTDDGIMGPATLAAAQSLSLMQYGAERGLYYSIVARNDELQGKFFAGWMNRVRAIVEKDY